MSEIDYLTRSRGYLRGRVTKLCDKVSVGVGNFTTTDKLTALSNLESWRLELKKLDDYICADMWKSEGDEAKLDEQWDKCELYEQKIVNSLALLKQSTVVSTEHPAPLESIVVDHVPPRINKLKLPEIPLPTYRNAHDESLSNFLADFENIIQKYDLSDYEKFVYLKRQLSDEPLTLIGSLSGNRQSFEGAKLLLREAFANTISQKYGAIRRLAQLSLTHDGDPYKFISEMRSVQDLFKTLDISSDTIIQYFIWNAMTSELQSQLVNICNTNKPVLHEINDNIFKALERYKEILHKEKSSVRVKTNRYNEQSVHGYAATVTHTPNESSKQSYKFCTLCSDSRGSKETSHTTNNCTLYKTPQAKINRLKEINACYKCGYGNHTIICCTFKFGRKCFHCNGEHMSFLCTNDNNTNNNRSGFQSRQSSPQQSKVHSNNKEKDRVKSQQKPVAIGVVWAETTCHLNIGGNSILPTFQCTVVNKNLRCLKDSGCQGNFINVKVANELKLPVVCEKYTVTVNGFNQGKSYDTKVVSIPLNICNRIHNIDAICVPSISTNIKLPGLRNVASAFVKRGYKLADPNLVSSDDISGLDLILGMENPEVLLEKQILFGSPLSSVVSETSAGVMLYGNLDRLKNNLGHIPHAEKITHAHRKTLPLVYSLDTSAQNEHPKVENCTDEKSIQINIAVTNDQGKVDENLLKEAVDQMLQLQCNDSLGYDKEIYKEDSTELDDNLIDYVLNKTTRREDGRLEMPLTWRGNVSQFLGKNFNLAKQILNTQRRLKTEKLQMIDDSINEWRDAGIIERVDNLSDFLQNNPVHSFLPHMGVFRMDRETTKCRVVFLSNLCEKNKNGVISMSHNQVIHPGPCLNPKITTALMHLRFDETLLCYDLKKAFLSIALSEEDSNRLLFLWFKNVKQRDFSIVAFKNLRLSFGLRCSPTILMLGLYKILCMDVENDSEELILIKRKLYALLYMDNGAFTGNTDQVREVYNLLDKVYEPYSFSTQQLSTNSPTLQAEIDKQQKVETSESVKLLGLDWRRNGDLLSPRKICLNGEAKTKRSILQTIASQYDTLNLQGPCLNRARLFMHSLQTNKEIGWDTCLNDSQQKQWRNIAKQANRTPPVTVQRSMGPREDPYELIGFADSSKSIYASVVYLQNARTKQVSFLAAKNRLVNKQLELKTIPTLELQAITLGVEMLMNIKTELSGSECMIPINITKLTLYSDSSISLHWLNSQAVTLDKMQKRSVFVRNRLDYIERQCENFPITFRFVSTTVNPADCLSRCLSFSQLQKSCYLPGPEFLRSGNLNPELSVTIPNPQISGNAECTECHLATATIESNDIINLKDYSSLEKALSVLSEILRRRDMFKLPLKKEPPRSVPHRAQFRSEALKFLIRTSQKETFSDLVNFLKLKNPQLKEIPQVVNQLNLFLDEQDGIVKMKSKFDRWKNDENFCFPILLHYDSVLVRMLIYQTHNLLSHSGCYCVLAQLRKQFWFARAFSTVKRILRECVICRRFNSRPVKLNQSSYRRFRAYPKCEPYKFVFLDYLGPFFASHDGKKSKVWLLIITCLWSRSVNLIICPDMTVVSFLRALQMHVFQEGLPNLIFSDLGSQIVAGAKIIKSHLNDADTQKYLASNGVGSFEFEHYFKGNSSLGSLVEICVKFTKRLIYGSIRNNVLPYHDFSLIVSQTIHLINKRPLSFREALRDETSPVLPAVITPELLNKGRELVSLNIIPAFEPDPDNDANWSANIGSDDQLRQEFAKARKVRENLIKIYNDEFQQTLINQAINSKDSFKPVNHTILNVGDIVLLKDPMLKVNHFPMGIVRETFKNEAGEVTNIVVKKGSTRELVKRHVSSIIPLVKSEKTEVSLPSEISKSSESRNILPRTAARKSRQKTKDLLKRNLV